ncbi:Cytochrome c [Anatilimnocola aggregata]|uniref:Cytochrome c n=1 Tax=Anatilimnocola aggregata TaxID=2528021 RepID=A0A517YN33_9BACT|nr:hypothetical protein [Anatilimnocola aggregata]QDU31628.1 Cytochrome c [Anatilimnocola aggregata]
MPATESTWRSMTLMHRIFAVGGVVLTLCTVWMFYKDHFRSWKKYQETNVLVDRRMTQMREDQYKTDEANKQVAKLEIAYSKAKASPIDPAAIDAFGAELKSFKVNFKDLPAESDLPDLSAELKTLREVSDAAVADRAAGDAARAAAEAKLDDAELQRAAKAAETKAAVVEADAANRRASIVKLLQSKVDKAFIHETQKLGDRKGQSAHVDKAKADLDIAIRDNLTGEMAALQKAIDTQVDKLNKINAQYQALSAHRKTLEAIVKQINAPIELAFKDLEDSRSALKRLATTAREKRETFIATYDTFPYFGPGKQLLNLPILDAFGATRKPENRWSEGLLQDYNFAKVRRFDRCTTCHGSMQKSLPGDPTAPLYTSQVAFEVVVTPRTLEEVKANRLALKLPEVDDQGQPIPYSLEEWLGLKLADHGLVNVDDVVIKYVQPKSPGAGALPIDPNGPVQLPTGEEIQQQAATGITPVVESPVPKKPGLLVGDVIATIAGSELRGQYTGVQRAAVSLIDLAAAGKPFRIGVLRGLKHPFNSHPRLDLFLSDSSPHKLSTFACTICHEGQGSATDFKWASHTPNDPTQAAEWSKEHGWFNNHHWIFPMYPARFTEATCLKCHHDVVELEPSQKFPDPPAEKLMHGYRLIRMYGCYGCHEVNGYDGPTRRVGPDMRLEPSFFAAAQQLAWEVNQREQELRTIKPESDEDKQALAAQLSKLAAITKLATQLTAHPAEDGVRHTLLGMIEEDQAAAPGKFGQVLAPQSHRLAAMFRDVEAPGTLRKPGPSLRSVAQKVDTAFLYDWIWNPKNFRESTRMPRFFGLWDHLADDASRHVAEDLEPIEVRGLVAYLMDRSQKFDPVQPPEGVTPSSDEEKLTRGKQQFETRGCLACHTHHDFPDTKKFRRENDIVQGPDLSNIGAKFSAEANPQGPTWLYSWIKEPTKYHARTVMPNLFLEPLKQVEVVKDAEGNPVKDENGMDKTETKIFDPAADITTYLLSDNKGGWKPVKSEQQLTSPMSKEEGEALRKLMLEYLNDAFFKDAAEEYFTTGLPEEMRSELKGAETELITPKGVNLTDAQRLRYIGLKTVSKYGCFGCHDIPGFEDAKPIGTQLQNWGRKDPSRLAFEHISHYIGGHGAAHGAHGATAKGHDHAPAAAANPGDERAGGGDGAEAAPAHDHQHDHMAEEHESLPPGSDEYYHHELEHGSRIGFIYQKLKEPRSYDFDKTLNKRFNERLRMPQFPFTATDREAIITFVLGLVAEPPREKYLYRANPRDKAIAEGKVVLEKFNCGGCHILEADKWKISYPPGQFGEQSLPGPVFPFLQAHFSPAELSKQATPDASNRLHSTLLGFPALTKGQGLPELVDLEDGELVPEDRYNPKDTKLSVEIIAPTIVDGFPYLPGQAKMSIPGSTVTSAYTDNGGMLTRYLLPRVTQIEQQSNPNASGSEAYGWLPPPLFGEGSKVQNNWLYEFLLQPYPIRPAVFLRMPKFNLSSDEATKLVNYFAAIDNANYPYESAEVRLDSHLAEMQAAYERQAMRPDANRLDDAMKIVVDKNFCVKCHIVGDYDPGGSVRAKAPDLAEVHRRLRPDYLKQWIGNPKMVLPYTAMPVNIPYTPGEPQGKAPAELFVGDSVQQVQGLVDLLMNFDQFSKGKNQITPLVPVTPPAAAEGTTPAAGATN